MNSLFYKKGTSAPPARFPLSTFRCPSDPEHSRLSRRLSPFHGALCTSIIDLMDNGHGTYKEIQHRWLIPLYYLTMIRNCLGWVGQCKGQWQDLGGGWAMGGWPQTLPCITRRCVWNLRHLGEQSSHHGSVDRYWSVGKIIIEVIEVMVLSIPYLDTLLNCTPCHDV